MDLDLNPRDDLPLYAQLARQLRQVIAAGHWPTERPLPSVRSLVGVLRVNHQTVLRAYADLEAEGLIERRQGQGTFVVPGAVGGATRRQQREVLDELARLAAVARELGVDEAEIEAAVEPRVEENHDQR
jgi:GntR family transcriptional regulator